MKVVMFYHSLLSDWNHGNAHFLRGVVAELGARGHQVEVYEPRDGWSLRNQTIEAGDIVLDDLRAVYPGLHSHFYDPETLDLDQALDGTGLILVHEWNDPAWVRAIGEHRPSGAHLFFHDTHHRAVSEDTPYDLSDYDGVLAYGAALRDLYLVRGSTARAWVWHEAADVRVYHPIEGAPREGDLVWIGNWGDDERTAELHEFLIEPVRALGLKARVYGVRYPNEAQAALASAGIDYASWLPNFRVPQVFARYRVTVHVPRRYYVSLLSGIPTIRPFEALACGIPLVMSPWEDMEGLFTPGADYLVAQDSEMMARHLRDILHDTALAEALRAHGLETILARHTCAHRVDELVNICRELSLNQAEEGQHG